MPSPSRIWLESKELIVDPFYDRGGVDKGLFWHVLTSLKRVAFGFSISAVVGMERLNDSKTIARAVRLMEEHTRRKFDGIMGMEIGGGNGVRPLMEKLLAATPEIRSICATSAGTSSRRAWAISSRHELLRVEDRLAANSSADGSQCCDRK